MERKSAENRIHPRCGRYSRCVPPRTGKRKEDLRTIERGLLQSRGVVRAAHGNSGGFVTRYERIRKVFRDEFPTRGRWPIPMEEAFSLLYVSKDFPEIYVPSRGRHRKPGSRREIEDFLRLTFGILSAIEARVDHTNLYARLVSHLGAGETILTLNYDTLLDSALVDAGWNPVKGYGLMGGSGKSAGRGQSRNPPHH